MRFSLGILGAFLGVALLMSGREDDAAQSERLSRLEARSPEVAYRDADLQPVDGAPHARALDPGALGAGAPGSNRGGVRGSADAPLPVVEWLQALASGMGAWSERVVESCKGGAPAQGSPTAAALGGSRRLSAQSHKGEGAGIMLLDAPSCVVVDDAASGTECELGAVAERAAGTAGATGEGSGEVVGGGVESASAVDTPAAEAPAAEAPAAQAPAAEAFASPARVPADDPLMAPLSSRVSVLEAPRGRSSLTSRISGRLARET